MAQHEENAGRLYMKIYRVKSDQKPYPNILSYIFFAYTNQYSNLNKSNWVILDIDYSVT